MSAPRRSTASVMARPQLVTVGLVGVLAVALASGCDLLPPVDHGTHAAKAPTSRSGRDAGACMCNPQSVPSVRQSDAAATYAVRGDASPWVEPDRHSDGGIPASTEDAGPKSPDASLGVARDEDGGPMCDPTPSRAAKEVCNGVDDDCDGWVDEGVVSEPCTAGVGQCAAGLSACVNGAAVCIAQVAPTPETCNGLDDNCDGLVDDGFGVGSPCDVGVGQCLRSGHVVCSSDAEHSICDVQPGPSAAEDCNGLDDNCDGLVDYTLHDGKPESACLCEEVKVQPQTARPDYGEHTAATSTCAVSADGMSMTAHLASCAPPDYTWAQCMFESVWLDRFDADHLAAGSRPGALEISFCTGQVIHGSLAFYYGTYPLRKRIRLLSAAEEMNGLPANCYDRFFAPSDVECPTFPGTISPSDGAALAPECRTGCDQGRWADRGAACAFDYDGTLGYLTMESCRPGIDDGMISVTQFRVRYHSPNCVCIGDAGCRDLSKPICDNSAALPRTECPADDVRCAGICVAP